MNTKNDVLRERYIYGAELVGKYGFPKLPECYAEPGPELKPVPYHLSSKEKRPRECILHFNIHDYLFESLWYNSEKNFERLRNFKYVISPDFSVYADMPKAMQIYQFYRRRAMTWWLWLNEVNVIPSAGWGLPDSYDYCFDGLPKNSTLAISTNGAFSKENKEYFIMGFREMCRRLDPKLIVCIGRPIETGVDVPVIYYDSVAQQFEKEKKKWVQAQE